MNDLIVSNSNLPTKIEDLSKFVLVGREKLTAMRAELRAMNSLHIDKGIMEQRKQEVQLLAEDLLDCEARIGEKLKDIPKDTGGRPEKTMCNAEHSFDIKPKKEVIKDLGFNQAQVQRFETLADNKPIIEQIKAEARYNDEIVTRTAVLNRVQENKEQNIKPHVSHNSGENEWYTPKEYIDAARKVMGTIDLDPATSETANKTVNAIEIYTIDDNGLEKEWGGNVWLNPPYSSDLIGKFATKLVDSYTQGEVQQAIVMVNNATETQWFNTIIDVADAVVFPKGRIKFVDAQGNIGNAPLQGQAFIYIGHNPSLFLDVFSSYGWGACL